MKFTMLFRDTHEALTYAKTHMGKKFGNGASLDRVVRLSISDAMGAPNIIKSGLALECTGNMLAYVYHKIKFDWVRRYSSVIRGWFA